VFQHEASPETREYGGKTSILRSNEINRDVTARRAPRAGFAARAGHA
jgi:hypothetical protein